MDFQLSADGIKKAMKEIFDNFQISPQFQFCFYNGTFDNPTAGPLWFRVDTLKHEWFAESNERSYVENRETKIFGDYDTLYDVRDILAMFSDEHAHDRLRAMARAKYGYRSFT